MNLLKSKHGEMNIYIGALATLFVFGLTSIIGYLFLSSFDSFFQLSGFYSSEVEYVSTTFLFYLRALDWVIVLLMFALIIGVGVTFYKLTRAPIFFLYTFFMAAFLGLISYIFNYLFAQTVSNTAFVGVITYFPNTILICTNFHWIALLMIIIGSITLYLKNDEGGFVEA